MKINAQILSKAIYDKCLECSESAKEVELCEITRCPLHSYRMAYKKLKNKDSDISKAIRSIK